MNEFFLNEHSLHGQYTDHKELVVALKTVLDARNSIEEAGFRFYSNAKICYRKAIGETILDQAVRTSGDKELKSIVLSWLSKTGPFWSSNQLHSVGDMFACMNDDVAGSAIAEAACRYASEGHCALFSFTPSHFNSTPLDIQWTRHNGGAEDVLLDNFWNLPPLDLFLKSLTPIKEWRDLFEWAQKTCKTLLFSNDVIDSLRSEPFSFAAACEIQMLLLVLDDLSKSVEANGLNAHGLELHKKYFQGHHARFSDEAANPKFDFIHPKTNQKVQCSWHGKVRLGCQYRIHFEWPKPNTAGRIWVAYIGPKLTKW